MKKLLCLFSVVVASLTSCSNNDNDTPNTASAILPKTSKYTDPDHPSENSTTTAVYNGNKIVSLKDENSRTDYTYDGNVIVKSVSYKIVDGKDVKNYEESYTYTNNKLATVTHADNFSTEYPTGEYKDKSVYTHNADGTVKRESYDIDTTTGVETKDSYTYVNTFVNGNLVKAVATNGTILGSSSYYSHTDLYEYDTKNNPFKNILGFNLLMQGETSSLNNIVKHTSSSIYGSGSDTSGPFVYKTEYVYDANGFPTKRTSYKEDGTTVNEINEFTY